MTESSNSSADPTDEARLVASFAELGLIGRSDAFVRCLRLIDRLSACDAPVLIEGATGTGKELAARALHYRGVRRGRPFVPVNCGALPDSLVENELFGHARGAFTDAKGKQRGLVEQADGGTLFLDEVDALTPHAQVALLRFLEGHEFRPLGACRLVQVDIRVIAASNSQLTRRVAAGSFREDLLFRLNVVLLRLPPLEVRTGDAELLAEHFLRRHCLQSGVPCKQLAPDAIDWIRRYRWPGNIRELENLMHRAFVLSDSEIVRPEHLQAESYEANGHANDLANDRASAGSHRGDFSGSFQEAKADVIDRFEKAYLRWLMREARGNVTRAARRAGKERRALGKLLKKHGIDHQHFLH